MSADAPAAALDAAWGHTTSAGATPAGIGSFTRARVERVIQVSAGLGLLVVGVQAFVAALAPSEERPGWHVPLVVAVFATLALMLVACLVGRGVRITAAAFACAYAITLVLWPVATAGSDPVPTEGPWIWYLLNMSTLAAVLAFPILVQIVWTAVIPLLYGLVRLIQGGFAPDFWIPVALDVSFGLILGGLLLVLVWMFRSVATNVDRTRALAVESYAAAAAADAAEQERIAVAALMHDSVLAALIAAERADSARAKSLAVAMAREALTRLANTEQDAGEGSDEPWAAETLAADIETAATDLGAEVHVDLDIAPDAPPLPGRVARALSLAATQAVANAIEHAAGADLDVRLRARTAGVRIDIEDHGGGFDLDAVPDDRLGIRASIIARVAAIGGVARVAADDGGTRVRLTWKAPDA